MLSIHQDFVDPSADKRQEAVSPHQALHRSSPPNGHPGNPAKHRTLGHDQVVRRSHGSRWQRTGPRGVHRRGRDRLVRGLDPRMPAPRRAGRSRDGPGEPLGAVHQGRRPVAPSIARWAILGSASTWTRATMSGIRTPKWNSSPRTPTSCRPRPIRAAASGIRSTSTTRASPDPAGRRLQGLCVA